MVRSLRAPAAAPEAQSSTASTCVGWFRKLCCHASASLTYKINSTFQSIRQENPIPKGQPGLQRPVVLLVHILSHIAIKFRPRCKNAHIVGSGLQASWCRPLLTSRIRLEPGQLSFIDFDCPSHDSVSLPFPHLHHSLRGCPLPLPHKPSSMLVLLSLQVTVHWLDIQPRHRS